MKYPLRSIYYVMYVITLRLFNICNRSETCIYVLVVYSVVNVHYKLGFDVHDVKMFFQAYNIYIIILYYCQFS